jgi:hypothetical protein
MNRLIVLLGLALLIPAVACTTTRTETLFTTPIEYQTMPVTVTQMAENTTTAGKTTYPTPPPALTYTVTTRGVTQTYTLVVPVPKPSPLPSDWYEKRLEDFTLDLISEYELQFTNHSPLTVTFHDPWLSVINPSTGNIVVLMSAPQFRFNPTRSVDVKPGESFIIRCDDKIVGAATSISWSQYGYVEGYSLTFGVLPKLY